MLKRYRSFSLLFSDRSRAACGYASLSLVFSRDLHSNHSFKSADASVVLLISQKFCSEFIKNYLCQQNYFSNGYVLGLKMTG